MNKIFTYSLLKYIHSDLLGEAITVGILFHFPDDNLIIFKHPKSLSRLKDLYKENFSDSLILSNLKGISKKCVDHNKKWGFPLQESLLKVFEFEQLKELLLRTDGTALRFSENKTVVLYSNYEVIVKDYFHLLFSYYDRDEKAFVRKDEEYISRTVRGLLKEIEPEYQQLIKAKPLLSAPKLPEGVFEFDFSWQNQVVHYVKPLSFDLAESKSINSKAAQYYGYFSAISDELGPEKIDILTVRPKKPNLWAPYEKAIELIESVSINKHIVEHNGYKNYAQSIIDGINHN